MRRAIADDIPALVELMADFYAEAGYSLNRSHAAKAFDELLRDERPGFVWIIEAEGQAVGHLVLTLRYAMEYGGVIGCVDDLYVVPAWRNKGLSTAALEELRRFAVQQGLRALTVEVGLDNGPAQAIYRRLGFRELANRQLLALELAAPSHD